MMFSMPAPLSPFSDFSTPSLAELDSPSVLSLDTPAHSASPDISLFHDEASLTNEVLAMLPTTRHLMVVIHAKLSSAPPTMSWITDHVPNATRALFVVSPIVSLDYPIRAAVGVIVLPTEYDVAVACAPGKWGSSVTVTSFASPSLPVSRAPVQVPGSKDLMQIDELYELENGQAGVCAVLTLGDVKKLLPQDEEECRTRVLLVKRCHKLGNRCSSKMKAYFDAILGKEDAVEHVLMLPLKARCASKHGRSMPPKTGFVVFRDPSDAMLVRALGGEQFVEAGALIKVETYDGL